jgi:hypothetical protein
VKKLTKANILSYVNIVFPNNNFDKKRLIICSVFRTIALKTKPHEQILFVRFHSASGIVHFCSGIGVPDSGRVHFLFSGFHFDPGIGIGYAGWFHFAIGIGVRDLDWFYFDLGIEVSDPD